ncbi:ATP-binding protein [Priestia megaterium]|uniref:ATP-binding protein n=1 Tax=Priestia megaterium TaxID=1404 RepID=UPI000BFD448C|nr:ATP-binding protein [Priestia megaterium]PGX73059.1 hypothetical protein COE31_23800 [Priestia megaterium]
METTEKYIIQSHERCETLYHLNPKDIPIPKVCLIRKELQRQTSKYESILQVTRYFMEKILEYSKGIPTLVVVSNENGFILDMYGDKTIQQMVDSLGITTGVRFDERDVGTNSISLALQLKKPVEIIGKNHFQEVLHSAACFSAPFYYSPSQVLSGTISLMTTIDYASSLHLGLLSSAIDSIERELKLQEQNYKLDLLNQILMHSTQDGILITDTKGKISDFNEAAKNLFEVQENFTGYFENKQVEIVEKYIDSVLQTKKPLKNIEIDIDNEHKENLIRCLVDVLPLFDSYQKLNGAFLQFRDMSEFYKLQEQVIASEKLSTLGILGTGFAHEIKNPLTAIIGLIQLLQKPDIDLNTQENYLNIISKELERIKDLTNQFASLGKPTLFKRKSCDIDVLIKNTVALVKNHALLHNIEIKYENKKNSLKTEVDESQIKQVLINLLQNAIDAMQEGGEITVSLDFNEETEQIKIVVQDNGVGMTAKELESISKPFFSTKERGIGLGLHISYQIIESHGGKIRVNSIKDKGSTFTLYLPAYSEQEGI